MADVINDPETKQRKSGVVYIQTVPPMFTVSKLREVLSTYAEIGRLYLQVHFDYRRADK